MQIDNSINVNFCESFLNEMVIMTIKYYEIIV